MNTGQNLPIQPKFYCVFIHEEQRYITLCRFNSKQEAEMIREKTLARSKQYSPSTLKVMTSTELSQHFGSDWIRVHSAYS
jgi:hypothetical protein